MPTAEAGGEVDAESTTAGSVSQQENGNASTSEGNATEPHDVDYPDYSSAINVRVTKHVDKRLLLVVDLS